MPLPYASQAALSAVDSTAFTDHSLAETVDNGRLWLLYKTDTTTPLGANSIAANPAGRWLAAVSSGPPYVDVDVEFGTSGNSNVTADVAATWVTATTSFRWSCQEATSTKNPEDAAIEGLRVTFPSKTDGVGFSLFAQTDSLSVGTFRIRVTGERTLWQQAFSTNLPPGQATRK